MLKIFDAIQTKELDRYTIQHEPVASIDLMERACRAFMGWFTERFDAGFKVGVVCGTGNNGGDGLGIARMLKELGYNVNVWVVKGNTMSEDFKINLGRLQGKIDVKEIVSEADQGLFHDRHVLIDALFGTGLSRSVSGIHAQAIGCMNKADAIRIAIDIPSGLMTNRHAEGPVVRAKYTVSFQMPKLAFLLPENAPYVGEWFLVDIGLSKTCIHETPADYLFLQRSDIQKIRKPRSKFSHKGTFGHALLIAGSYGKIGAAILAARAALRTG